MPTQYDIDHAAFVRRDYRRYTVHDTVVESRNPVGARVVAFDTNLDAASAARIANAILADNHQPRAFQVEFEGTLGADPLVGGPPAYLLTCARYGLVDYPVKAVSIAEDYESNRTTVQVRG